MILNEDGTISLDARAIAAACQALLGPERTQVLSEVYGLIEQAQQYGYAQASVHAEEDAALAWDKGFEAGMMHLTGAYDNGDREGYERGFKDGYDIGRDEGIAQKLLPPPAEITNDVEGLSAEDTRFADDVEQPGC